MNNCAVDSALGAWEREQTNLDNKYDTEARIMQPFVAAIADIRKIIDALPLSDDDKHMMKSSACLGLHETKFAEQNIDIDFDDHIINFYASI